MTKQDLISEVSKKTGVEKKAVENTVEALMETIRVSMSKNENIYLRSFGSFAVKKRAKKTARNISKGTTVIIPEHYVPTFKPAKEFVNEVKSKKNNTSIKFVLNRSKVKLTTVFSFIRITFSIKSEINYL